LQINELLKRLEEAFVDMSEYAAKVAHELRTPLTILRLKVEQAGNRIDPELAEELHGELHQLAHIVKQSLLVAKAEQGRLVAYPSVFDLAAVLQEAVADFSLLAEEQGRSVRFQSPRSAFVRADAGHLRQILHNLLTNALTHGQGPIQVDLHTSDSRALLAIRNRVRHHTSGAHETFGLGLRVVRTLSDLQPDLTCGHHVTAGIYAVELSLPSVATDTGTAREAPVSKAGFDVGI